ncbi:hypothetical protein LINPERPRIM_LOCUS35154 [Linum perenne]
MVLGACAVTGEEVLKEEGCCGEEGQRRNIVIMGVFPAGFSQSAIASPSTLCTTLPLLSQSVTFGTNQPTHEMMRSMASSEIDSSSSNYMGRSEPAPIEKKDTELAPIQIPLI